MKYRFMMLLMGILSLTAVGISWAQETCPELVETALRLLDDNCNTLERNSACYGYNLVSAEFTEIVENDYFTEPGDSTPLDIVEVVQTAEMDVDLKQWGLALMNLQANIPNTLPGQAVKLLLLGDVDVESNVHPETSFKHADAINATVINNANIRSGAGLKFNTVSTARSGESLPVDGRSPDGEWYRVIFDERVGWIFSDLLEADDRLDTLPVLDGTQRSLMQYFFLRNGIGVPACDEAPEDTLIIQGPENIEIDLTVNGVDIRIGSTIAAQILAPGDTLEFTVIDGTLTILNAGPNGTDLVYEQGEMAYACLQEPQDIGLDGRANDRLVGCDWSAPASVPIGDFAETYCVLENIPSNLLNYPINLNCSGDSTAPLINNNNGDTVIPIAIEATSASPPPPTPEPIPELDNSQLNLCNVGNSWGDGRCNNDFWWNAGFYYGLYEAGLIELTDIPEPYYIPPPVVEVVDSDDDGNSSGNPIVASISCIALDTYEVTVSSAPVGDVTWSVTYFETGLLINSSAGAFGLPGPGSWSESHGLTNIRVTTSPSGRSKKLGAFDCS